MADLDKLQHSSLHNYEQRILQDQVNLSAGLNPIPHNLGYVPRVRVWAYHLSGQISSVVVPALSTTYHSAYEPVAVCPITKVSVTKNELRIETSSPITIFYRIYLDAA